MNKPPTIKEVESELVKKIPEILGLETTPDGVPNYLLIRDEDDEVIEAIDFSDEVVGLKQFFIEKMREMLLGLVGEERKIKSLSRTEYTSDDYADEGFNLATQVQNQKIQAILNC